MRGLISRSPKGSPLVGRNPEKGEGNYQRKIVRRVLPTGSMNFLLPGCTVAIEPSQVYGEAGKVQNFQGSVRYPIS